MSIRTERIDVRGTTVVRTSTGRVDRGEIAHIVKTTDVTLTRKESSKPKS